MAGPRSDPPIPMLTISRMGLPLYPCQRPEATLSENCRIWSRTWFTEGMTSRPSTTMGRLARLRKATCRTGRFSVALILSPANILRMASCRPASFASAINRSRVCSVIRFLEKSTNMSSKAIENLFKPLGIFGKQVPHVEILDLRHSGLPAAASFVYPWGGCFQA